MSASVWTEGVDLHSVADKTLNFTARFWFVIAVAGQWMFAYYVAAFYGGAALRGDLPAWNKVMPHGYVPGDTAGNLAIGMHLLLAVVIIVGGPLSSFRGSAATLRPFIAGMGVSTCRPCSSPAWPVSLWSGAAAPSATWCNTWESRWTRS